MTFYTSLTGLQASQTEMSTISHNLANVSTNGFKKSRTEFADIIASNVTTAPTLMVGSGTVVKANRQQFTEGSLIQSGGALDLAISGDGFFAVKPDASAAGVDYTRNGSFLVDSDGSVVDEQGGHLQVYPTDGSGAVVATGLSSAQSLKLPATSGTPVATKAVTFALNLNAGATAPTTDFNRFNPSTYNNSTQTTIYDAGGNPEALSTYFRRGATAADGSTTWTATSFVGDKQLTSGGKPDVTLSFDASGKLTAPTTPTTFDSFTTASSVTAQSFTLGFDGAGTTQLAAPFNVASATQDGKAVGQLTGVTVDSGGIVKASFSNGDNKALGQVVMANFNNPEGLRQIGTSYWEATGLSGEPKLGAAGSDSFGKLMSGTIERSNVDITEELVDLIAAQRNFQANSKALDTQSQTMETIFNIRS
jgi:flagellar hook protein FlgE